MTWAGTARRLTYYLLFALFPLLVFISTLLGILKLDVDSVTQVLSQIVPADVMSVLESYLEYVSANASRQLLAVQPDFLRLVPHAGHQLSAALPAQGLRPGSAPEDAGRTSWPSCCSPSG